MGETIAELLLKFDLEDKECRNKFYAILNSYQNDNFIVDFIRYLKTKSECNACGNHCDCHMLEMVNNCWKLLEKHSIKQ